MPLVELHTGRKCAVCCDGADSAVHADDGHAGHASQCSIEASPRIAEAGQHSREAVGDVVHDVHVGELADGVYPY